MMDPTSSPGTGRSPSTPNSHTGEKSCDSVNLWSEITGCFEDYPQIANKSVEHIRLATMIEENRDALARNILVADAQSTVAESVAACLRNGIFFSFAAKANKEGLFDDLKAFFEGNADGLAVALRLYHALHPGNPALSYDDPDAYTRCGHPVRQEEHPMQRNRARPCNHPHGGKSDGA
jgi:hypothetical protein